MRRRFLLACSNNGPTNELILTYNVTSTSAETLLISNQAQVTAQNITYPTWDISQLKKMYIDDVEYAPKRTHKFSSTGTHTVRLIFNDTFHTMGMMFATCSNLVSADFTKCDLSNVTIMGGAFGDCTSLTSVNFNGVNTSNVTTMMGMFDTCTSLASVDLSPLDTSNVTDFAYMFNACSSLTSIDLSTFNTTNLTDMYKMFTGCSSLVTANLSSFVTSKVIDMSYLFQNCSKLQTLDMRNIGSIATTSTGIYKYMLSGCLALTTLYWGMKTAPSVYSNTFGNSSSTYTGYTNRRRGTNKLYLPTGHSGYTSSSSSNYWRSRLQSTSYGGFTIATY
jgi:surface protein